MDNRVRAGWHHALTLWTATGRLTHRRRPRPRGPTHERATPQARPCRNVSCSRRLARGEQDAYERLVEPHRRELHAHCYRMLGSVHDAEDALQDALAACVARPAPFPGAQLASLLAVPDRDQHVPGRDRAAPEARAPDRLRPADRSPARAPASRWSSRCGSSRIPTSSSVVDDGYAAPEARYERREAVELAFIAALQHLPPRQRAVLILREVLGFSAREVAETLDTTTASVNSALQRARGRPSTTGSPSRASRRRCARSATSGRARGRARLRRRLGPRRRRRGRRDADRGRRVRDAAAPELVPRPRRRSHSSSRAGRSRARGAGGTSRPAPTVSRRSPSTPGTPTRGATCRSRSTC